jgi:hypothetical protein
LAAIANQRRKRALIKSVVDAGSTVPARIDSLPYIPQAQIIRIINYAKCRIK